MKKIVGINSLGYNQTRNIAGLPFKNFEVKKVYDFYKIPTHLYYKLKNYSHYYYLNSFNDFGLNKVDVLHFFNAISYGSKPWLTTSEYVVPRYFSANANVTRKGLLQLTKPNFKKLISMSQAAHDYELNFLNENFSDLKDEVIAKMQVILPSQKLLLNNLEDKKTPTNCMVFTLIASNNFFGKGGKELLNVFDVLLSKKYDIKLNIIPKITYGDWASQSTKQGYDAAMKIVSKYPNNIFNYDFLPNAEVLKILNETHIGLLPTYAETFGYSALESMASGCPVISTNIFALPEINNNELGWLIDVPKQPSGDGIIKTENDRKVFSKILEDGLLQCIVEAYSNPEKVKEKAMKNLKYIDENHKPENNANIIEGIYEDILAGHL